MAFTRSFRSQLSQMCEITKSRLWVGAQEAVIGITFEG